MVSIPIDGWSVLGLEVQFPAVIRNRESSVQRIDMSVFQISKTVWWIGMILSVLFDPEREISQVISACLISTVSCGIELSLSLVSGPVTRTFLMINTIAWIVLFLSADLDLTWIIG